MSLQEMQNEIETATIVTKQLELEKEQPSTRPSGGSFSTKVRSGIRRELSAFRKVLEGSKSRLQELQDMQDKLEQMEEEPALSPKKRSSSFKKRDSRKSPHWLPSLGRRKKFFDEDIKDVEEDSRQPEEQREPTTENDREGAEEMDREGAEERDAPSGGNALTMLEQVNKEDNGEIEALSNPNEDALDPSLAMRESLFRTTLQARALALKANRPTVSSNPSIKSKPTGTDGGSEQGNIGESESSTRPGGESLTEFANRLEKSIRMMRTFDLIEEDSSEGNRKVATSGEEASSPEAGTDDPLAVSNASRAAGSANDSKNGSETRRSSSRHKAKWGPKFKKTFSLIKSKHSRTKAPSPHSDMTTGEGSASSEVTDLVKTLDDAVQKLQDAAGNTDLNAATGGDRKDEIGASEDNKDKNDEIGDKKGKNGEIGESGTSVIDDIVASDNGSKVESPHKVKTRVTSFHNDGWKEGETEGNMTEELMTEESIAAQELRAREAYIKALQENQALLSSGMSPTSPEVVKSQQILQERFAKIEYWERMREEFNAGPQAETPRVLSGTSLASPKSISAVPPALSGDPQDVCYVGEKELKARETYIKAMRQHQELVSANVKPDSPEWIKSEKAKEECLANLQFWENLNSEVEIPVFEKSGVTISRTSSPKAVYRVSQENKDDRHHTAPMLESLVLAARDKLFKGTLSFDTTFSSKKSPVASAKKSTSTNGVAASLEKLHAPCHSCQEDGCDGWASTFDTVCVDVLPFCYEPGWVQNCGVNQAPSCGVNQAHGKSSEGVETKKKQKTSSKKGAADKKQGTATKSTKQKSHSERLVIDPSYCCGSDQAIQDKDQPDPMCTIEYQAKEILGHLNLNDSSGSVGGSDASPRRVVEPTPGNEEAEARGGGNISTQAEF
ncbi:expressed unknown protein [Seminavis robusta]|uniref:Uncharacterized protein n=1 Tax=Seminavis robusta TaxID=568900 RepID=A0A9N8HSX9_9STRA|nr:expressed unknown protein [Seminavis robusta]|eukprot:Sro1505_g278190.1 n/a (902) ;mRNA; r:11455-14333